MKAYWHARIYWILPIGVTIVTLFSSAAHAHPGAHPHEHADTRAEIFLAQNDADDVKTSGQGAYTFRVFQTNDILDATVNENLVKAHGGFAVDRREGHGEVYFAIPGAGIIRVDAALDSTELLDTPNRMVRMPLHNTAISYGDGGEVWLTFPSLNNTGIYTTSLSGEMEHRLAPPTADTAFDVDAVSKYFADGGAFVPTDVDFMGDRIFAVTGYSPLDYALTAKVDGRGVPADTWEPMAFGGKGDAPEQFTTGHGITLSEDGETLIIADREHHDVDYFDGEGNYLSTTKMPTGCRPCDVDVTAGLMAVACLESPEEGKGAPVILMKDGEIVSTVWPKTDLGLANFTHIHNAALVERDSRLYLVLQAWNPGDFAILEQVK